MSGFIAKLRTVTLGTVHDLLDKAIDMNSPSALRQYTRDLEDALEKMTSDAAIQAGTVRTLEREKGDMEHHIETDKLAIVKILASAAPQKEDLARMKGAEIVRLQKQLESNIQNLAGQRESSAAIDKALAGLQAKHQDMVSRVRELERLDRDTKAKEAVAKSLQQAGRLANSGADISVDDIESKMRARNDIAGEKMSRALGAMHTEEDPTTAGEVDALISSLRPKELSAG